VNIKRRTFSKEFKLHVLREVQSGKTAAEVARQYQLHPQLLVKWRNQFETYAGEAFGGSGKARSDTARMAAQERKITHLLAENELLKKALSQFDLVRTSAGENGHTE
jgi:transposase